MDALKASLRDASLVLTKVVQGSAAEGDTVEVYCVSGTACGTFVVCSGDEAAPVCSVPQPPLQPHARLVIERPIAIGREDWVWLADPERREMANTRVGFFDCEDGQGRSRADCALAASSVCGATALGTSAGPCPEE